MLPTSEIPKRLLRRGQSERMKARAARQWRRWHRRRGDEPELCAGWSYIDGRRVYRTYSAKDLRRDIGRLAAMHCTHVCEMCKHEKHFDIPKVPASESVRIYDLVS